MDAMDLTMTREALRHSVELMALAIGASMGGLTLYWVWRAVWRGEE